MKKSRVFIVASLLAVLLVGTSACENSSEGSSSQNQSQPNTVNHSNNRSKTNKSSTSSTQSPSTNVDSSDKNNGNEEAFYGQWQIKKVIAFGPAGTYSSDDIKTLTGKQLTFSKESATCFGDQMNSLNNTTNNPVYKKTVISKSDFPSNYRVTFDKLGIKGASITEVDATGTKGICSVFFITQDNNKLILFGGGVFFELDRISNQNNSISVNSDSNVGGKEDNETLSQYSSEQIEYARVWLQLGPNQDIDELYVRNVPAGTPLNPDDNTNVSYPEDIIQLTGSRIVDGIVTYSGNGDGTINVYNVPRRWYGGFSRPDNVSVDEIREEMKDIIKNTKLVTIDPGDDEKIIKLIKLLNVDY